MEEFIRMFRPDHAAEKIAEAVQRDAYEAKARLDLAAVKKSKNGKGLTIGMKNSKGTSIVEIPVGMEDIVDVHSAVSEQTV